MYKLRTTGVHARACFPFLKHFFSSFVRFKLLLLFILFIFFLAVQFWQYTTYRDGGGLVDHDDVLVHVYHRDRLRGDRHLVSATHQSQPA